MLKVFEKPRSEGAEAVSYLFHFTSPTDARPEANALKALLTTLIAEARGGDPSLPKPASADQGADGNGAGASAAMSFASAANAKPAVFRWFDDEMLKADVELQQSLLERNSDLKQTYTDARSSKPEAISDAAFNAQFWVTRINLLRAYAIELNQKKGSYNVLSTIKPRVENDELKLKINVEQVQMIFQQHPIVKRIYNENVPKLSEGQFWSQFFLSRLYKRLRGERVTENDDTNPIFDKYNESDITLGFASRISAQQIPHIIDLEANEENQGGFKGGNQKDVEMRPRANIPIVKTLNSLSGKIMANVAPADQELSAAASADADVDDSTFSQLSLRDLRGDAAVERIILNVKQQNQFFSNQSAGGSTEDNLIYEKQVPSDVLFDVQADIEALDEDGSGGIDLHKTIGVDDDSDSDGGGNTTSKQFHVGSRASRKAAQDQIFEGVSKKRAGLFHASSTDEAAMLTSPMSIPTDIAQRCYITNATTTEFLKQFWGAFLSGDPARVQELAYHAESLQRSIARIDALAAEAEAIRNELSERRKKEMREIFRKTGKKTRWVPVGGGKDAGLARFETTLASLNAAQGMYRSALGH